MMKQLTVVKFLTLKYVTLFLNKHEFLQNS